MAGRMKTKLRVNKIYVLVTLVALLVSSLAVLWFLNNFERKEDEIRTRQSPEARQNPLLAATLFLQELGIEAESHRGRDLLVNLPPAGDALFIYQQSGALSPTQLDNMYEWIDAGGHLILAPKVVLPDKQDEVGDDDLVSRMGVKLRYSESESDCGCDSDEESEDNESETELTDDIIVAQEKLENPKEDDDLESTDPDDTEFDYIESVSAELSGVNLDIEFSNDTYLEEGWKDPDFSLVSAEQDGAYLLQYKYGSGKISVLTESSIFNNSELENTGHSYLFGWLVKDNPKVWLLYSNNVVGIYTLLYQNLPQFLFSLTGFIIFFIWMYQYRIGALRGHEKEGRRNILAHIDGMGQFNWSLDKAATLLTRTREPMINYWTQRALDKASGEIDIHRVSELSGMDKEEVKTALYDKVKTEQDLIAVCRCPQNIRNVGAVRSEK